MNIPILSELEKLIVERGSAVVQTKHIALLKEQIQAVEKQLVDCQKENATLKSKLTEFENQIAYWTKKEGFIQHYGALFKRKSHGSYDICVYCPKCFGPMSSLANEVYFRCTVCKTSVNFTGHELNKVMSELPK